MKRRRSSRKPTFVTRFDPCERRLLPTAHVVSAVFDGTDLTGLDASVGPDGLQDLHVSVRGLQAAAVTGITVTAPGGFAWVYGPNSDGSANAEYFAGSDAASGELYFNPTIRSNRSGIEALPSSTGSPVTVANGMTLTLTITHGTSASEVATWTVQGLPAQPSPMPTQATPATIVPNAFHVDWSHFANNGQDGSTAAPPGFVHLRLTDLKGPISTAQLSDPAGAFDAGENFWASGGGKYWDLIVAQASPTTADIYFPPYRDETRGVGAASVATAMTLRITYAHDPNQYVTQFAGADWQTSLLASPFNPGSVTVTSGPELAAALADRAGPGIITLPAGAQLVLTQPLRIMHSVQIQGNNATLLFQPHWTDATAGAIVDGLNDLGNSYVYDTAIDLENLTIRFDPHFTPAWYNPAAVNPDNYAVINLNNANQTRHNLTLNNVTITGPPALAPTPPGMPDSNHTYVGEAATNLVRTGPFDSGSITKSTFQGGPIAVFNGPWTITGNTHSGALSNTYTSAAFAAGTTHDVFFDGNTVTQRDPTGRTFRLINFAGTDFGNTVSNNQFTGGGVGDEVSFDAGHNQYTGINDPEVIVTEQEQVFYEGITGAVSADGLVLVLPPASTTVASRSADALASGPGWVVSILDTSHPSAGQWVAIAQQISTTPPTFLLQAPLPVGKYAISITPGFVDDVYTANQLNIAGKSATGLVLISSFGAQITNNTITGGTYDYPYTGRAIDIRGYRTNASQDATPPSATATANVPANTPAGGFPLPYAWTDTPSLGLTIRGNTVFNSVGGISLGLEHVGSTAHTGRVYLAAELAGNTFGWDQSFLTIWDQTFHASTNGNPNHLKIAQIPPNSAHDSSQPPTITVNTVLSASQADRSRLAQYVDPAEVSVHLQGNVAAVTHADGSTTTQAEPSGQVGAAIVNGVATIAAPSAGATPPFNLGNLNIGGSSGQATVPVPLDSVFNEVGITDDTNPWAAVATGFDFIGWPSGNSISTTALGATSGTIQWNRQTFTIGSTRSSNVLALGNTSISLPAGQFATLLILGASTYGDNPATFVIHYTDGTTSAPITQTFSDWAGNAAGAGKTALGESIALAMPYYNSSVFGRQSSPHYLYGYSIPVDPSRTVSTLAIQSTIRLKIVAIDLVNQPTGSVNVGSGGTASDSGAGNPTGEEPARAFDRSPNTKWLTYASSGYLQYQFAGNAAQVVTQYALTAGADTSNYSGRAPKDWTFLGSNDGVHWTTLDTQTNQADTTSGHTRTFTIANRTSYRYYRLNVTANNGDGKYTQLAELQLLT